MNGHLFYIGCTSMWTRHNRHSLQINTQCYILQFRHLKHYIKLGTNVTMTYDMWISSNHLQRWLRNLLNIMTGQRTHMVILWQWVGQIASCVIHYHLHFFSSSSSWKAHTYQEASPQSSRRHWKNCRWIDTWPRLLLTELFKFKKCYTEMKGHTEDGTTSKKGPSAGKEIGVAVATEQRVSTCGHMTTGTYSLLCGNSHTDLLSSWGSFLWGCTILSVPFHLRVTFLELK